MSDPLINLNLQIAYSPEAEAISNLPWADWFATWAKSVQEQLPPAASYELSLRLTDDAEMLDLNYRYRQIQASTDVLAFAALETNLPPLPTEFSEPLELGDIVISVETAQRQAQENNHSWQLELSWLASHGFLHLLGWDHPDQASLVAMVKEQEKLLRLVGLLTPEQSMNFVTSDYT